MNMNSFGILVVVAGLVILIGRSMGIPLGKLPGDLVITGEGYTIMFPITTMILLSIVLSVIRNIISK